MDGMKFGHYLSSTSRTSKTHLVNLELPDERPNVILCHGTAQMPTVPFSFYVLMVVLPGASSTASRLRACMFRLDCPGLRNAGDGDGDLKGDHEREREWGGE